MENTAHISGYEKIVEVLGYFPSFHDAEVISFSIERSLPISSAENIANLSVHVRHYKTVGEGTSEYAQVLSKSILVNFIFHGARDIEASEFNHQNVINGISVKETPENPKLLLVIIESIWGFGCSLKCGSIQVSSVQELPVNET